MLRYVYGDNDTVAQWVAQMIPHVRNADRFGHCATMGVVKGNTLIAGIVWSGWNKDYGFMELTGASVPKSGWMARETVHRMYDFPFRQCGCQLVLHTVRDDDPAAMRIVAAVGCALIRLPRLFGRECDAIMGQLTAEDWATSKFNRKPKLELEEAA